MKKKQGKLLVAAKDFDSEHENGWPNAKSSLVIIGLQNGLGWKKP